MDKHLWFCFFFCFFFCFVLLKIRKDQELGLRYSPCQAQDTKQHCEGETQLSDAFGLKLIFF